MASRRFPGERIQRIDPRTGIKVIQLTSYPTPSVPLDYSWPSVTTDNGVVFFTGQTYGGRTAPWELFRCDTDGLGLWRLTDRGRKSETGHRHGPPKAVLTLDARALYALWPHDNVLCRVDPETGDVDELVSLDDRMGHDQLVPYAVRVSCTGRRVFVDARDWATGRSFSLRVDLAIGGVEQITDGVTIHNCYPDREKLLIQTTLEAVGPSSAVSGDMEPGKRYFVRCDENGTPERVVCENIFAHSTLLGKTGRFQGAGLPPERCIWVGGEDEPLHRLAEGPYCWHSGASLDGEWIVTDTNWPSQGLYLVHVATGHIRSLCNTRATSEHPQSTHPHPALSPDGRIAVFKSDWTGMSQVYVARITDEFRESVVKGELDNPKDKWI